MDDRNGPQALGVMADDKCDLNVTLFIMNNKRVLRPNVQSGWE